jgi:hypothetical protein
MTEGGHHQPDPGEQRPFDLESWREHGFSEQSGLDWWRHRIDPAEALRWQRVAVAEPIDAVRWKIAGIGPDTVREWIYAKIDAREAVAWTEMGFSVAEARKHKRAGRTAVQAYGRAHRARLVQTYPPAPQALPGRPGRSGSGPQHFIETVRGRDPQMIHSYMHRRWFDDEAIAWASHGIDAADALAWKELGLTPVEAERCRTRDGSPMQTAKAWWQAGIPFEEVADWIGAGLIPEEAVAQRAKGVTAERAAVLRSLRKDK